MNSLSRRILRGIAALPLALCFGGCAQSHQQQNTPNRVQLFQSPLFVGELKRLEPHLDMQSGFFTLVAPSNNTEYSIKASIWENGKIVSSSSSYFKPNPKAEISFSISPIETQNSYPTFRIITNYQTTGSGSSSKMTLPLPEVKKQNLTSTTHFIYDKKDINFSSPTPIWGLFAYAYDKQTEFSSYTFEKSAEEMAKLSSYAIFFTVQLKNK